MTLSMPVFVIVVGLLTLRAVAGLLLLFAIRWWLEAVDDENWGAVALWTACFAGASSSFVKLVLWP